MNLLEAFKTFLFSQDNKPTPVTVKNYLSDINHFVRWYEKLSQKTFSPSEITRQTLEDYKKEIQQTFSASSLERHLSSLRKFFYFLKLEGQISLDPFKPLIVETEASKDPWHIKDFKSYLYVYNASHLTIKNYLIDIKQFLSWAEEVTGASKAIDFNDANVLNHINSKLIEEYKERLVSQAQFSPATINRKLSSLRKYLMWAQAEKLIKDFNIVPENMESPKEPVINLPSITPQLAVLENEDIPKPYSKIPPLRFAQKLSKAIIIALDSALINPLVVFAEKSQAFLWNIKGQPVFQKAKQIRIPKSIDHQELLGIKNLPKDLYAPLEISTKHFPLYKKILFKLRYTRPQWYKTYHSYAIAHYFNFAILIIFLGALSLGFYNGFFNNRNQNPALASVPTNPPRILSFQGRLTDASDNPITSNTNMRFAIYNSNAATGSALLWQEVDNVTPDVDGIFNLLLGNNTAIPSTLFSENNALWLGVTVENTPELTPRQQLATVAFASNSETLQGLLPITATSSGTTNVVLALDSSGNLTIGGTANPTFQASGGQFKLSGQPLVLTTNTGSNGSIQLVPDGTGKIDLSKPLVNRSISNNISTAVGAVEVDDLFAILASSSGQSALTINQTGAGPLISASASGVSKFTVDNSGNVLPGATNTSDLGSTGLSWRNIYGQAYFVGGAAGASVSNACVNATNGIITSQGTCSASAPAYDLYWNQSAGALFANNSTVDILLGGQSTNSAALRVVGHNSPSGGTVAAASVSAKTSFAALVANNDGVGDLFTASSSGVGKFTVKQNGTVQLSAYSTCTLKTNSSGLVLCDVDNTGGGGSSPFTEVPSMGIIIQNNTTEDLLIGGTSTASATFHIYADGTASFSGDLNFNGAGTNYVNLFNDSNLVFNTYQNIGGGGGSGGGDTGAFSLSGQGQLPQLLNYHSAVTATVGSSTYVYVIGGATVYDLSGGVSTVYRSTIDSSGNLGAFSTTNQGQMGHAGGGSSAVTVTIGGTNYIYTTGGIESTGNTPRSSVYKSTIDTSGNTSAFQTTNQAQLPRTVVRTSTIAANVGGVDYVYSIGGLDSGFSGLSTVYKSTINGSQNLGTFATTNQAQLPVAGDGHNVTLTYGGTTYIYAFGYTGTAVYRSTINSSGDVGTFATTNQAQLPQNLGSLDKTVVTASSGGTNYIYVLGGASGGTPFSTVYRAQVDSSGNISTPFTTTGQAQLQATNTEVATAVKATIGGTNYIYFMGGSRGTGGTVVSTAYKSQLSDSAPTAGSTYPALTITNTGTIGVGTDTPLAALDIRGETNTLAIASVSGNTSFAALVVDNSGSGDLFSANVAGSPRFAITNAGGISLGGTVSDSSNCIRGGATATWAPCDSPTMYSFADSTTEAWVDADTTDLWDGTIPNITPTSSSDEILVMATGTITTTSATDVQYSARIFRNIGANPTCQSAGTSVWQIGGQTGFTAGWVNWSAVFVDTPATTSNVRYTVCTDADTESVTGITNGTMQITLYEINDNADLAEVYPTNDQTLLPGELVSLDPNLQAGVQRASAYDKNLIGVVSTKPALTIGGRDGVGTSGKPIAMSGRVPVKVSTENGPIKKGDVLTSSSIPGVAMRATKAGPTVGIAMTEYDGSGIGSVIMFVKTGYFNGTDLANLLHQVGDNSPSVDSNDSISVLNYLVGQKEKLANSTNLSEITTDRLTAGLEVITPKVVTDEAYINSIAGRVASFSGTLTAQAINATGILTNELSVATENVTIGGKNIKDYITGIIQEIINSTNGSYISPIASIDALHTNIISPVDNTSKISLDLSDSKLTIRNGPNATDSAVASIDNLGNATFSGSLAVGQDASIAGTLRATRIIADQIEGLNAQASVSANYITNITNIYNSTSSSFPTLAVGNQSGSGSGNSIFGNLFANNSFVNIATLSSQLAYVDDLNASTATFYQGLMSFGPTSLSDTSIAGQLSVDGSLILSNNAINVLGSDLSLQPLRQGGLSIMAGLFYIDTNGNVQIQGDVTVNGTLYANLISPIPGNDLSIKLGTTSALQNESLKVKNASGSAILSLNQLGDLVASGEAQFAKLNLNSLTTPALAVSSTETIATGSAGVGKINAYKTEMTINNPLVTENSLIYITPTSNTNNQVLYLQRQIPNKSFTVGVQNPSATQIPFNWIIVN